MAHRLTAKYSVGQGDVVSDALLKQHKQCGTFENRKRLSTRYLVGKEPAQLRWDNISDHKRWNMRQHIQEVVSYDPTQLWRDNPSGSTATRSGAQAGQSDEAQYNWSGTIASKPLMRRDRA